MAFDALKPFLSNILEIVRRRKLMLGKSICLGCRCTISFCDTDLNFDLAVVTLKFKILSGL